MTTGKTHFADDDTLKYIEELEGALQGLVRIVEAFGYTTQLGANQKERLAKAKRLLAKSE